MHIQDKEPTPEQKLKEPTPKQKLEEACFKYVEATYIQSEVTTKNALCLIDSLYEDDSLLLHLRYCETPKI